MLDVKNCDNYKKHNIKFIRKIKKKCFCHLLSMREIFDSQSKKKIGK